MGHLDGELEVVGDFIPPDLVQLKEGGPSLTSSQIGPWFGSFYGKVEVFRGLDLFFGASFNMATTLT